MHDSAPNGSVIRELPFPPVLKRGTWTILQPQLQLQANDGAALYPERLFRIDCRRPRLPATLRSLTPSVEPVWNWAYFATYTQFTSISVADWPFTCHLHSVEESDLSGRH